MASDLGFDLRRLAALAALLPSLAFADALVGAGVGNADTFVSEGSKLFNKKQYAKASDQFLKATRANPATVPSLMRRARRRAPRSKAS